MTSKTFFEKNAITVAEKLLGMKITYDGCSGIIVETEAYQTDEASHATKRTKRSEIMYSTQGHWYVYLIYGMYNCLNLTTNGYEPGAVLIRAIEPTKGIKKMKKRRKQESVYNLCNGPGKLCQSFKIDKKLNGTNVNEKIFLTKRKKVNKNQIVKTNRIGISKAQDLMWRFYLKNNDFVSKK